MATVYLKKGALTAKGYVGFSWTTLFFGFLVPLFRGDWKWFAVMLIADICTAWVCNIPFAFIYNKIYVKNLMMNKGFAPSDGYSRQILAEAGFLSA